MKPVDEYYKEMRDFQTFMNTIFSENFSDAVIAGGYSRRFYMTQNDYPIKPSDMVSTDIDVFLPITSLRHLVNDDATSKALDNFINDVNSDDMSETRQRIAFTHLQNVLNTLLHDIRNKVTMYTTDESFESQLFRDIRALTDNVSFSSSVISNRSFSFSLQNKTLVIPIGEYIQLIFKNSDDILFDVVDTFDIQCAKFYQEYPYTQPLHYRTNTFNDIYHIDEMDIQSDSYIKVLKRMEKYSNYGFTFSQSVKDSVVELITHDDSPVNDLACYAGRSYV